MARTREATYERRTWGVRVNVQKAAMSLTWAEIEKLNEFIESGDEFTPDHPKVQRDSAAS